MLTVSGKKHGLSSIGKYQDRNQETIDTEKYLSEEWTSNEKRRKKPGVPPMPQGKKSL